MCVYIYIYIYIYIYVSESLCCTPETNTTLYINYTSIKKWLREGFPGGAVVKNPPATAGDSGLSPGPGRSHMPQSN